jgi:hypothetical protein
MANSPTLPGTTEAEAESEREAVVEAVWDEAEEAASHAWFPGGMPRNPYPRSDWRHDVFGSALGHFLARNGWH